MRRVECDYYTDAIDYTQVKILEVFEGEALAGAYRRHGDVRVNRQIVGFKKIKFYTNENVGAGKLSMPEMHTTSFWLHFPADFLARFGEYTPPEKAERHWRPGKCPAHGGGPVINVRPARSGGRRRRGDGRHF